MAAHGVGGSGERAASGEEFRARVEGSVRVGWGGMGYGERVPAKVTIGERSPNPAPSTASMRLEHDGKLDGGWTWAGWRRREGLGARSLRFAPKPLASAGGLPDGPGSEVRYQDAGVKGAPHISARFAQWMSERMCGWTDKRPRHLSERLST